MAARIPPLPIPVTLRREPKLWVSDFAPIDGSGVVDATPVFQTAIAYVKANGYPPLYVTHGTYLITAALDISGVTLIGARIGPNGYTTLKAGAAIGQILWASELPTAVKDMRLDGNALATDGLVAADCDVDLACETISATRYGFHLTRCTGVYVCSAQSCSSHGHVFFSCAKLRVDSIGSFLNGGLGFLVQGKYRDGANINENEGNCVIRQAQCEQNAGGVSHFQGVEGLTCWTLRAEGSGDCLKIEDCSNCSFYNTTMAGGAADGTKMVRVITSANIKVSGCHNQNGSGSETSSYFKIRHSPNAAANPGFLKEQCKYMTTVATFDMGEENDP